MKKLLALAILGSGVGFGSNVGRILLEDKEDLGYIVETYEDKEDLDYIIETYEDEGEWVSCSSERYGGDYDTFTTHYFYMWERTIGTEFITSILTYSEYEHIVYNPIYEMEDDHNNSWFKVSVPEAVLGALADVIDTIYIEEKSNGTLWTSCQIDSNRRPEPA